MPKIMTIKNNKQEAHQLVGLEKRSTTKLRPKAVGSSFRSFSNFDKCRLAVDDDIKSGVAAN